MHSFLSKDRRSIIFIQKKTSLNVCIFSPNETNIFLLQKLICLKDFSIASLIFFLEFKRKYSSKWNLHTYNIKKSYIRKKISSEIFEKNINRN